MALIKFEDKPSTKTPWNATNVNHNFKELDSKNLWNEGGTLNATVRKITISKKYEEINEFCFRILGTDSATFGYLLVPRIAWHRDGEYEIYLTTENRGTQDSGYAKVKVDNKTSNSFDINLTEYNFSGVVVYYRLT